MSGATPRSSRWCNGLLRSRESLSLGSPRGGEVGVGCSGSSKGRSRRADALRFRVGAEPAAEVKGDGPELEGREESAASLAAERVILEDMRS